MTWDVAVVGGGIIGLAVARELLARRPGLGVVVLEREPELATHQTGRNSGVVHAGLYYAPGSAKARLCAEGKQLLEAYCLERGIPIQHVGKLVVALDADELPRLAEIERRARANGVPDLEVVDTEGLRKREPHAAGIRAIWSPRTGIVDFRRVALSYADDVRAAGGEVRTRALVTGLAEGGSEVEVSIGEERLTASAVTGSTASRSPEAATGE